LRNPVYLGKVKWNGQLFPALHQPIITETKMEMVKDIFSEKIHTYTNNKTSGLLKGLLFCGHCDKKLIPSYTRKKNGKVYLYYRCGSTFNKNGYESNCAGQYIPLEEVNTAVKEQILSFASEEKLKILTAQIKKENQRTEKEINLIKAEAEKLALELKTIKAKKEKYLDSLIDGNFSKGERERINQKIDDFSRTNFQSLKPYFNSFLYIYLFNIFIQPAKPFFVGHILMIYF